MLNVSTAELLRKPLQEGGITNLLERGPNATVATAYTTALIALSCSDYLKAERNRELISGLGLAEAKQVVDQFNRGVDLSITLAEELLAGKGFDWWDIDTYRKRMQRVFASTSDGQFVAVGGQYALNRVGGAGPIMFANHTDLFANGDYFFLDALTNATVTNLGQGYPFQILSANALNRITGGAQCPPYHPGPLMDAAAEAVLSIAPLPTDGARVAWFNSGGDAVSVGIAAAEKYTRRHHGENGMRKAAFFREAYHGNIEGRAGRATSGINQLFHEQDRNSVELEFPDRPSEVEPVLAEIQKLIDLGKLSCVVMEATQGDGGGVSMDPDFFVELMRLSLDNRIPIIVDEVQSGFGRSGRVFEIEYLLKYWRESSCVQNGGYPEKPPFILAIAKNMTNGAAPGSAVIFPKEYAVLGRAQGLNTYSAHPTTLAATIASVDLMQPETLALARKKRAIFDETIGPFVGPDKFIRQIRGHGLHLFLDVADNQQLQIELLGTRRVLTGTVARNGLRVHAPINAPDVVWHALARVIGETSEQIQQGQISPQALQILQQGGPSGLAVR